MSNAGDMHNETFREDEKYRSEKTDAIYKEPTKHNEYGHMQQQFPSLSPCRWILDTAIMVEEMSQSALVECL